MTSRAEHLAWCKQRALEYVDASDTRKHPETDNTDLQVLGMSLMMSGHLDTPAKMRRWIEGFN